MLSLTNINKSFGDNKVLDNLSVEFLEKKTTVLIGSSGSGKSTLLRCINLISQPDSGQLTYGDIRIDFPAKKESKEVVEFKKKTGMVFQSFNLFTHLNVKDNITLSPRLVLGYSADKADEVAKNLLGQVGLDGYQNYYPENLSGGQQQRVAIARALAMEPEIILFDEPTSALDPEIELEILDLIMNISKENFTNIIVTHNMKFAEQISDEVIFMDKGKIAAQDTFTNLINDEESRVSEFLRKSRMEDLVE